MVCFALYGTLEYTSHLDINMNFTVITRQRIYKHALLSVPCLLYIDSKTLYYIDFLQFLNISSVVSTTMTKYHQLCPPTTAPSLLKHNINIPPVTGVTSSSSHNVDLSYGYYRTSNC